MIKGLVIASNGLEIVAKDNIEEILDMQLKDSEIAKSVVIFSVKTVEQLCKLCYMSQASARVLLYIGKIASADADKAKDLFSAVKLAGLIKTNSKFRARCKNNSDEIIEITELEKQLGSDFIEYCEGIGISLDVDLKNPDVILFGHMIDGMLYLGIDLSGDIAKRDYRIFNRPLSLKGTTAFGLLKLAGYEPKDVMVDTFCNSGTIEIEAALYASNTSPKHYNKDFPFKKLKIFDDASLEKFFKDMDKSGKKPAGSNISITAADALLRNITAAKKNAKMAGVEKFIGFRRIDTDWLDLKFEKGSVDKIITFIPGSSKHKDKRFQEKQYKELFYQAEYILNRSGIAVVLCLSKELLLKASDEYMEFFKEEEFSSGEQIMRVLFFRHKRGVK